MSDPNGDKRLTEHEQRLFDGIEQNFAETADAHYDDLPWRLVARNWMRAHRRSFAIGGALLTGVAAFAVSPLASKWGDQLSAHDEAANQAHQNDAVMNHRVEALRELGDDAAVLRALGLCAAELEAQQAYLRIAPSASGLSTDDMSRFAEAAQAAEIPCEKRAYRPSYSTNYEGMIVVVESSDYSQFDVTSVCMALASSTANPAQDAVNDIRNKLITDQNIAC